MDRNILGNESKREQGGKRQEQQESRVKRMLLQKMMM